MNECLFCQKELTNDNKYRKSKYFVDLNRKYHGRLCRDCYNWQRRNDYLSQISVPSFHARKLARSCKSRAKEIWGKEVLESKYNLDYNWILNQRERQNNKCFFSGVELDWSGGTVSSYTVSVDRIVPNKGYTKDNCVLVCYKINAFKGTGDVEELYDFAERILELRDDTVTRVNNGS